MKTFAVILAAAGQSRRFSASRMQLDSFLSKKPFVLLKGRAVWLYSAEKFRRCPEVKQIILAVSPEDRSDVERKFASELSFYDVQIAEGGKERFESVENALKNVENNTDFVAVHDAARPCVTESLIKNVFQTAEKFGAAFPAVPLVGTIKKVGKKTIVNELTEEERVQTLFSSDLSKSLSAEKKISGLSSQKKQNVLLFSEKTVARENLWEAQTPQVFRRDILLKAFSERGDFFPTDDVQLLERIGESSILVESDRWNIKITSPEDLFLAEKILEFVPKKKFLF